MKRFWRLVSPLFFLLAACPEDPPPVCGNTLVEEGEECDDGNLFLNDGCTPQCTLIPEDCADLQDNDLDFLIDCFDPDCDTDAACQAESNCNNNTDDDADGPKDCADSDCAAAPNCNPEADCADQQDNDLDNLVDCFDSDCDGSPDCKATGQACDVDSQCIGGICLDEDAATFPGGYCTSICENTACNTGETCLDIGLGAATCFDQCQTSSDCRSGYDCFGDGAGGFVCFPDCDQNAECTTTGVCETTIGFCVDTAEDCDNNIDDDFDDNVDCFDPQCAQDPQCQDLSGNAVSEINLGAVPSGQIVNFTIPANTEGFMILVSGQAGATYSIDRLVRPDAFVVLNDRFDQTNIKIFSDTETTSVVMPQNDRASNNILPGTWQLRIFSTAGDSPNVRIFIRPTPFIGGSIEIKFYIPQGLTACRDNFCTPGQVVNPQNAVLFDEIQGLLNTFFAEFYTQEGGFSPGRVSFFEINQSFLTISSDTEFDSIFANSALGGNGGLHLFLVQAFDGQFNGSGVVGRASGIPGAIGQSGSRNTGVVISLIGDPRINDNFTGFVTAHEVGHFLGLFHTTEFNGQTDQMNDTASCSVSVLNGANPENCPDASLMMFPALLDTTRNISNGQKKPLRAGPLHQ